MQNPTNIPGPGGQCTQPVNTGGAHWLLNSAIYWLNQWVTNGTPPRTGSPCRSRQRRRSPTPRTPTATPSVACARPRSTPPIAVLAGIGNTPANSAPPSDT